MLLSKVRSEWHQLPSAVQTQLAAALYGKLTQLTSSVGRGAPPVVINRLTMVLAAAAAGGGASTASACPLSSLSIKNRELPAHPRCVLDTGKLVGNALEMAQQGGRGGVAVGLLTALAEHADDAERSRRQTLTAALMPRLPEVCTSDNFSVNESPESTA
jgi:hypothetical protein